MKRTMSQALRDAEYDLAQAKKPELETDIWLIRRKIERNPDYVPSQTERWALSDAEPHVLDERPLRELRGRQR